MKKTKSLDYSRVANAFRAFLKNTDEKVILGGFLNDLIHNSKSLLDIGAGTGNLSKLIGGDNKRIIAVEPENQYLDELFQSLEDLNSCILHQKIEDINLFDISFDSFLFCHSLSYVEDYPRVIDDLCSHLEPGGLGIFVTSSTTKGDQFRIVKKYWDNYHSNPLLVSVPSGTIIKLLEKAEQKPTKIIATSYSQTTNIEEALTISGFFLEIDINDMSLVDKVSLSADLARCMDKEGKYKLSTVHDIVYFEKPKPSGA